MRKFTAFVILVIAMAAMAITAHASSARVTATQDSNLRWGPGKNYQEAGFLAEGQSMIYKGMTDTDERGVAWYAVDGGQDTMWISSNCAKVSGIASSKEKSCVWTQQDVNLRWGPGMDHGVYQSVPKGMRLEYMGETVTDKRGVDWYQVSYDGLCLWISSQCAEF